MTAEPGAIVAIPFPFSDLTTRKRRPVLVLSEIDQFGDFAALAVTSSPNQTHAIEVNPNMLLEGSLPKTSWVRYDKIFTLSSRLITHQYAKLNAQTVDEIRAHFCRHFHCP
ncbi:type II toxin-antitoxin system PemK/MazF family toxin [Thioalkalivibrio sp. ALE17]|uniref:type II toxin-antitoxin system PemK/MazF family toxin n=1 Tax=Thioalkalivibrio sp. ALE17 TaxID=1158173 RepID=UPI0004920124|nr:type II toxin-antitoxin system PemK/MazF family toxin [Thioalkalivibrio sp. ALE17]